jgi:hypothetical protein
MHINWWFFQFESWKSDPKHYFTGSGCWFRIFGYGLHFTNGYPSFSERYGYIKKIKIPFTSFRCSLIKKNKNPM